MNRICLYFVIFLILLFFWYPSISFAENKNKPITMDTMVVTGDKISDTVQTGDVDLEETPVFYSVIEREEFEGKMENLAEVIEKQVGVQVRSTGGFGSYSTVSLRGAYSDQVMIFLDGILLNEASGGGVNLSNISLSDIEAIEIYRGATPINFGKASMGGAINIRTMRAKEGFRGNVGAGYGSFNTRELSGFINHKPAKWDYLISADHMASDNDFDFLNINNTGDEPQDDFWEKRNNAQVEQKNILGKFGLDFSEDKRIDFVNQWFAKDQGLPMFDNSENDTRLITKRDICSLSFIADNLASYSINTRTRLEYSWLEEEYDDRGSHIGSWGGSQHYLYTTEHIAANFFLEWITDWNVLSFMTDIGVENYDPKTLNNNFDPNSSTRKNYTIAVEDSIFLFNSRLSITPAVNYLVFDNELRSGVDKAGNIEPKSSVDNYVTPQIGLKFRPSNWLNIKTNMGKYVREPSFFEMYGDRGFFVGNDDLEPEKGINFDIGFEADFKFGKDNRLDRFSCNGAFFLSEIEDLIAVTYDSSGIGRAINISEARINGIEAGFKLDFYKYFSFIVNGTLLDTKNLSPLKAYYGKKLPGRFARSYFGKIEYKYRSVKIYSECIIEKDMYYTPANGPDTKAEDKEEINAGVSWLYHNILTTLSGKNLGDNLYQDFNGYQMPGISYRLTVKYNF